jgi:Patatin-like phospholipase
MAKRTESTRSGSVTEAQSLPGQVVLVLQGGGALGAYQGGIYEALHEAGIEPKWVIGTSIGAINAGIIAGNPADRRKRYMRWTVLMLAKKRKGSISCGAWGLRSSCSGTRCRPSCRAPRTMTISSSDRSSARRPVILAHSLS